MDLITEKPILCMLALFGRQTSACMTDADTQSVILERFQLSGVDILIPVCNRIYGFSYRRGLALQNENEVYVLLVFEQFDLGVQATISCGGK